MTALPAKKLEAWRYTDLSALSALEFGPAPVGMAPTLLPDLGIPRVVFINGRYADHLSTPPDPNYLAVFAPVADPSDLPLAQINAEQAQDGITLIIPDGIDAGAILLVSHATADQPFAMHPRHRIQLGQGAALTLIEITKGIGIYWHNPVTDITLGAASKLTHYRLQDESAEAYSLATIRAHIETEAAYHHVTASTGAKLSRTEIHATLAGTEAAAELSGVQLLRGEQLADFTWVVAHKAPHCASRQSVKSVLAGSARGVFQGRIEVDRLAQKTDGYQRSQALLLSPLAEMDIKPELEIFADDVKCSHGATIGALDEEQLFYLRARGIPQAQARAMLIRAFLDETLSPVQQPEAKKIFDEAIEAWWVAA